VQESSTGVPWGKSDEKLKGNEVLGSEEGSGEFCVEVLALAIIEKGKEKEKNM